LARLRAAARFHGQVSRRVLAKEWLAQDAHRVGKSAELTTAIKETKVKSFHGKTLGDIVREIAGKHGLGVSIDKDLASRHVEHIDQQNESDVAFLTRLASRNGATFKVANGKAIFTKKGSKTLPSGAAKPAVTVKPEQVSSWSVTQSERGGHKSVIAYWNDHKAGKRKKATSGSGKPAHRMRHVYATEAEAKAAAAGKLGELNRGKRSGQIDLPGNPAFFAEGAVTLQGFDPDCDGGFFAKTVTHTFSSSGFTTSVSLETDKSELQESEA
jgi:phage protein D